MTITISGLWYGDISRALCCLDEKFNVTKMPAKDLYSLEISNITKIEKSEGADALWIYQGVEKFALNFNDYEIIIIK